MNSQTVSEIMKLNFLMESFPVFTQNLCKEIGLKVGEARNKIAEGKLEFDDSNQGIIFKSK